MSRVVVLDSSPLWMVVNPRLGIEADRCARWARDLLAAGVAVLIPEIIEYEVRRELIRRQSVSGLARLDRLKIGFEYVAITTEAMHRAAELWAAVRHVGRPTASPETLDADCILAGQALKAAEPGDEVIVATTNAAHLGRFDGIVALRWDEIKP